MDQEWMMATKTGREFEIMRIIMYHSFKERSVSLGK